MFSWRVSYPIAIPQIIAYNGTVFPMSIACTADLRYEKVPPKGVVANEYYFIITKALQWGN